MNPERHNPRFLVLFTEYGVLYGVFIYGVKGEKFELWTVLYTVPVLDGVSEMEEHASRFAAVHCT